MHNSGSWLTENASKFKSENEHFTVSRLNADQIAALRLFCFGRETKKSPIITIIFFQLQEHING